MMLISALSVIAGTVGVLAITSNLESKAKKNKEVEESKSPVDLDIKSKYAPVYSDFISVYNYFVDNGKFKTNTTTVNDIIHDLNLINSMYLQLGYIPKEQDEQNDIIPFYDLLLSQRLNWKAFEHVVQIHNTSEIPTEALNLMATKIKELKTEYVELSNYMETERSERTKNILLNLDNPNIIEETKSIRISDSQLKDVSDSLTKLLEKSKTDDEPWS